MVPFPSLTSIERLVFESGGCNGAAYIGCLDAVERLLEANYGFGAVDDFYQRLDECVGTSAGAFMAFAVCGGWRARQVLQVLNTLDLNVLVAQMDPARLFREGGLHDGTGPLRMVLQRFLQMAGLSPYATFRDYHDHCHGRRLVVFATRLRDGRSCRFDRDRTPDVQVVDALLASGAVPFLFKPVVIGDDSFIDGAMSLPRQEEEEEGGAGFGLRTLTVEVHSTKARAATSEGPMPFLNYCFRIMSIGEGLITDLRNRCMTDEERAGLLSVHLPVGMNWYSFRDFRADLWVSSGRRAAIGKFAPRLLLVLVSMAFFFDRYVPEDEALPLAPPSPPSGPRR